MNRTPTRRRHALALLALIVSVAAADDSGSAPELRRNPFQAPPETLVTATVAPAARAPHAVREPEAQREFRLRAVLSAGSGSLANIDGTIVGLGERIEGYRVTAIDEYRVALVRRGKRVVLKLSDDGEQIDD